MSNANFCRLAGMLSAVLSVNLPTSAAGEAGRGMSVSVDSRIMAKAFAAGGVAPEDAANVQVQQARELVTKTLGEDARDLVFVPISPCTVWDTRFASGAPFVGAIGNGVTRQFYSHLDAAGGDFTAYGGNPSCAEANQTFLGGRPYAAMMIVYVNNPVGNGRLTFYRDGDADPSQATISVYYSPGPTRTQTVISKSSRGYGTGTYDIAVTGRFSTADASASVVGYFLKPVNITLPASTATSGNILKGPNRFIHNYGTNNTFVGVSAGNFTQTGTDNTATGYQALAANSGGYYNTATGSDALSHNTTASFGTATGYQALKMNATGAENTANGYAVLPNNTTGGANTAIGGETMLLNTTGNYGTAVGTGALVSNVSGDSNVAIGYLALYSATGSNNIGIGSSGSGGGNLTTGSNNIAIGHAGVAAETGSIRIGTSGVQAKAFIAGIRGVSTANNNAVAVLIDSAGQLGTISSSRRVKDDIADMADASSALMKLRPVTFHYKSDQDPAGRRLQYGLVAEEVAEIYPGLVTRTADGQVETVMYQFLAPMLLNEYQRQQRVIQSQTREIAGLRAAVAEIAELRQQLQHVVRMLEQGSGNPKAARITLR